MSEFWTILWLIIKYGLIIGLSLGFVAFLIVVFHPICISLKGRGSLKGQRGEAKLSYLFGLLRLRYTASVHTQDVWLEFWRFKKLLQRESVISEKIAHKPNKEIEDKSEESQSVSTEESLDKGLSDYKEEKTDISERVENNQEKAEEKPKEALSETDITEKEETKEQEKATSEKESEELKENIEESSSKEDKQEAENQNIEQEQHNEELNETISEEEYPKVEATPEQLAQLQTILEEEEKKSEEKEKAKDKSSFNAKLRKFKKDFDNRYKQLRTVIILIKQKWNSLWPVVKRFWNRGKKGFRFHDAYLKVEYSLDEHYLTGMMCGYLAPTVGFAQRYGLKFEPIPVFPNAPEAGLYSKSSWQIDIKPYRLIWAVTALLFEKNLYKELYWLYKWRKEKRKRSNKNND